MRLLYVSVCFGVRYRLPLILPLGVIGRLRLEIVTFPGHFVHNKRTVRLV